MAMYPSAIWRPLDRSCCVNVELILSVFVCLWRSHNTGLYCTMFMVTMYTLDYIMFTSIV